MVVRTLIVDDEPLAREGLTMLLQEESDIQILQHCANGSEAIKAIERHQPDLVFLDIQMPRMSGLDVIQAVGFERMPLVIFVTAYDEYAVEAFNIHAVDYLLKPVRKNRLLDSLDRVRTQLAQKNLRESSEKLGQLLNVFNQGNGRVDQHDSRLEGQDNDRIIVRSHGHVFFLQASEILWIEAAGDYITIHTDKKSHLLRETMRNMENRLVKNGFHRIHRSTIINLSYVSELKSNKNNDYNVVLTDGTVLSLARSYKDSLFSALA